MAPSLLELPRPRTFLHCMNLRTGAEVITFLQIINKLSGLYGLLALLTGAPLSALQLSMYLYSALVLVATVYLYKHIRLQSAFQNLLLAHVYALDTVVNALYTAFFGVAWFYVLAQHPADSTGAKTPGAAGIAENAGFTTPKYNVSHVDIVAAPSNGVAGQDAVALGQGAADAGAGLGNAVFQSGSIMSITLIAAFWALRVYFVFVLLAFARQCLRSHIASHASTSAWYSDANAPTAPAGNLAENPFSESKEEGLGWKGKAGRMMLSAAPTFWLGAEEGEDWMRSLGGKFRTKGLGAYEAGVGTVGVNERERRRRSGTGPPAPPREMMRPQLADLNEVRAT